jgi:predicted dehydrogenase
VTVRVGVVGGGLVAQAEHIPYLSALRDRFELAALAEPSRTVGEALGARYGIAGLHADYRSLLDAGNLDAIVVCSPAGTHAQVVVDALEAGVHVFVEKPMCITLEDADRIIAARDRAGRVVQVGTMKRYDPAVEAMIDNLPGDASTLRYVSVIVNDPEFDPYFEPGDIVRGSDIPRDLIEETRRGEAEQVARAVGSGEEDVVRAFSESFLGSMLHDLNVVHGALERLGEPLPTEVVAGDWWHEGRSVYGALRLQNGTRADLSWVQLLPTFEYREQIVFMFDGEVHELHFPSPWLKQHPTVYRRSRRNGRSDDVQIVNAYDESFARELKHFHACITEGTECRTPPEGARLDIDVLTKMFHLSR